VAGRCSRALLLLGRSMLSLSLVLVAFAFLNPLEFPWLPRHEVCEAIC
jgi:hypothetical protein